MTLEEKMRQLASGFRSKVWMIRLKQRHEAKVRADLAKREWAEFIKKIEQQRQAILNLMCPICGGPNRNRFTLQPMACWCDSFPTDEFIINMLRRLNGHSPNFAPRTIRLSSDEANGGRAGFRSCSGAQFEQVVRLIEDG